MLRTERLNEIAKKEKTIDNNLLKEHLEYSSASNLYKNLNTATDIEENKIKVNKIKNNLADLIWNLKMIQQVIQKKKKKNRNRNNMGEIVEVILKFNQLEQEGIGLKILTPN